MWGRVWRTLLLLTVLLVLTATLACADVQPDQDGRTIEAGEDADKKPVVVGEAVPGDLSTAGSSQQATVVVSDPMMASATGYGHGKKHKSKSHKSGHKSVKGKKGKKSHESKKGHKSSKKGHFKKGEKKKYHDKHGKKHKAEDHKKKYYGSVKKAKKGKKGFKFGSKGHHKKGHKDKGFKNVYHKEEYQHKKKFYDDKDNKKYHDKHEKGFKAFKGKKGKEYKGGKSKVSLNDSSVIDTEKPKEKVLGSQILNLKEAVLDLKRKLKSPTLTRDAKGRRSSRGKKRTKAKLSEKKPEKNQTKTAVADKTKKSSSISSKKVDKKSDESISAKKTKKESDKSISDEKMNEKSALEKQEMKVASVDLSEAGNDVSSDTTGSKSEEKAAALKVTVKKSGKEENAGKQAPLSSKKPKQKNIKSQSKILKTTADNTTSPVTRKVKVVAKRAGIKSELSAKVKSVKQADKYGTTSGSKLDVKSTKQKTSGRVNASKKYAKRDSIKPDLRNGSSSNNINSSSKITVKDPVQRKKDDKTATAKSKKYTDATMKKDERGEKLKKSDVRQKTRRSKMEKVRKTGKPEGVPKKSKSKVESKRKSSNSIKRKSRRSSTRMTLEEHQRRIKQHLESIRLKIEKKKETPMRKDKQTNKFVQSNAKSPGAFSKKNTAKKRGEEYSKEKKTKSDNKSEEKKSLLKNKTRRRRDSSLRETQQKIKISPSARIDIDNPKFEPALEELGGKYKDEYGKKGKDKKGVYHDHKSDHKKKYDKKKFYDKKSSHGRSPVAPNLQLNCTCHYTAPP